MTPKEYKQMMDYLTRSGVKKQVKFASDIARPDPKPQVQQIDAINAFMRRNPINKADGGRIEFDNGGPAEKLKKFVTEFKKKNDGKLPTQKQIMDEVGGRSASIQKYLEEGVDYAKRLSKKEAARLGGAPIPKHVILADNKEALNKLNKKVEKLNRVNKLENKGVRFVVRKTQAGNFTPGLYYGGYGNKESFGSIEDLKTEFNKFKKTKAFKVYDKSKSMKAGGEKAAGKMISPNKKPVFDYVLKNPNSTVDEITKALDLKKGVVKNTLQNLYVDMYKRLGDQGAVYFKQFDRKDIVSVADSIKNMNINLKDRVKNLVIDAYKGDENLKPILKKLDDFYALQSEIKKTPYGKFFAANLDHAVPLTFIRQLDEGADPINLIKVKPMPEYLNQRAFKAQFDRVLGQAYATKNKKALEAIVNLQSYLPQEFGGITPEGKIKDYGAKPFSLKTNLAQTNFEDVYKRVFEFIKNPELQKTFKEAGVSFKSLASKEKQIMKQASGYLKELENLNAKGFTVSAKIPIVENIFNIAKSIPGDVAKRSYLKAAGKTLGLLATPLIAYDTYKAYEQGKPILETLEQGFVGTDLIGGTKRVLSLTPEERLARSVVKQDALKDLNLNMPMGFGFIEGPAPKTDMTLQEAQQKMDAGIQRVRAVEAQKNLLRSQGRGFGTPVMADQFLAGGGITGLSGGKKSGPPPISGPTPDGDEGLPAAFKNVRKR